MASDVQQHARLFLVDDPQELVQLLAAIATLRPQNIAREALGMYPRRDPLRALQVSLRDRHDLHPRVRGAEAMDHALGLDLLHPHLALRLQPRRGRRGPRHRLILAAPELAQLPRRQQRHPLRAREALRVCGIEQRAVLPHQLRQRSHGRHLRQPAEVVRRLRAAPGLEDAAGCGASDEDMPWRGEGGWLARLVAEGLQGGRSVLGGGAGRDARAEVHRGASRLCRCTACGPLLQKAESLEPVLTQARPNEARSVPHEEGDPLRGRALRRQRQAAAALVVGEQHEVAPAEGLQGCLCCGDRRRGALGRAVASHRRRWPAGGVRAARRRRGKKSVG
mmetsp:Transcript_133812/g.346462  ORF Transcript_133812/g.346462 Transcript_133812/m.346462 type:complete len:335 (+) Transcript_133812:762-1766(+)